MEYLVPRHARWSLPFVLVMVTACTSSSGGSSSHDAGAGADSPSFDAPAGESGGSSSGGSSSGGSSSGGGGSCAQSTISSGFPGDITAVAAAPSVAFAVKSTNIGGPSASVLNVPLDGGTPSTVAGPVAIIPAQLATDGAFVYYIDASSTGTLNRVPVGGGSPAAYPNPNEADDAGDISNAISYFALDGSNLAAAFSGSTKNNSTQPAGTGAVWVTPTTAAGGTNVGTVITGTGTSIGGVAMADGLVDWFDTVSTGSATVFQASATGGAPKALATGQATPTAIAAGGGHVFWTTPDGTIHSVANGSTTVSTFASVGDKIIGAFSPLLCDGTNVYFGAAASNGPIEAVPTGGGSPTLIGCNGQSFGEGVIATDGTFIYYTNSAAILRTPK